METLKKLLLLLLALTLMFCFAACDKEEPEETEPTLNPGDKSCEHVWTQWETTKENSCTKIGKQERECENCGKEEEKTLLAFGHTYYGGVCSVCGREEKDCEHPETETVTVLEASCTEDGEKRKICKLCKAVVDYDYIDAYWHSETEEKVIMEPTCTENGLQQEVCKLCGEVAEEYTLWATGHGDTEVVVIQEATCTENGLQQEVCKICNEVADEYTLWATGHVDTERVVVKEATCTENGTYQNVCTLCNEVDYEGTIRATGHEYTYVDAQNPTCTEIGWYSYSYCNNCDYVRNYSERPATGHSYRADVCTTCSYINPDFVKQSASGIVENILPYVPADQVVFEGPAAAIEMHIGDINTKGQIDVYTFEAVVEGTYCIQVKEVYSGKNFDLFLYNSLGEHVVSDTYCLNGDYINASLTPGTYTIQLKQDSGFSTYELYIYHKKPVVDVSEYNVINDKMEFPKQIINYWFTPDVTGVYGFTYSEILNGADLVFTVYDHLGKEIIGPYDRGNGTTMYATLEAGETYKIRVYNDDDRVTPFRITVGKAHPVTNLDGYTGVNGAITYYGQKDIYTFTATSSNYTILVTGNAGDVYLLLKNDLGENVEWNNYCGNGEGISASGLEVGKTYTVYVTHKSAYVDYTLHLYTPKPVYQMTSDMAVLDTLEYNGQKNTYAFTATRDGDHKVMILIEKADYSYMGLAVYDADGKLISSDNYAYTGDSITLSGVASGTTYYIVVSVYSGAASYTLSVQP